MRDVMTTKLAADDRARYIECGGPGHVTVIHDDTRCAADALRFALHNQAGIEVLRRKAELLLSALREAPDVEVVDCPGRLVGLGDGSVRCDVCGRVA